MQCAVGQDVDNGLDEKPREARERERDTQAEMALYRGHVVEEATVRPSDMASSMAASKARDASKGAEAGIRNMCELNSSDSDSSGGTASQLHVITEAEDECSPRSAGTQSPSGRTDSSVTPAQQAGSDTSEGKACVAAFDAVDGAPKPGAQDQQAVSEEEQSQEDVQEERAGEASAGKDPALLELRHRPEKQQIASKEAEGPERGAAAAAAGSRQPLDLGFTPSSPSSPSFLPWGKSSKGPVTSFSTRTPPATSNSSSSSSSSSSKPTRLFDAAMGAMANMSGMAAAASSSKPPLAGGGSGRGLVQGVSVGETAAAKNRTEATGGRNPLASFLSSRNDPMRQVASQDPMQQAQSEPAAATNKSIGADSGGHQGLVREGKAARSSSPVFLTAHKPDVPTRSTAEASARSSAVQEWKERERKSMDAGRSPGISPRAPGVSPRAPHGVSLGVSPRGARGAGGGGSLFQRRVVASDECKDEDETRNASLGAVSPSSAPLASATKVGKQKGVEHRPDSEKERTRKERFLQAQAALAESKAALSRLAFGTRESIGGGGASAVDDLAAAFLQGLENSPVAAAKSGEDAKMCAGQDQRLMAHVTMGTPASELSSSLTSTPSTSNSMAAGAAASPAVALLRCDLPRKLAQNESQEKSPGKRAALPQSPDVSPLKSRKSKSPDKTRHRSRQASPAPDSSRQTDVSMKGAAPVDMALLAGISPRFAG